MTTTNVMPLDVQQIQRQIDHLTDRAARVADPELLAAIRREQRRLWLLIKPAVVKPSVPA